MPSLHTYNQQIRRFCADKRVELLNELDVTEYTNRARREVALATKSLRRLTPISGSITSGTIVSGGANYTNPTVTITPPDFPSGAGKNPGGKQAIGVARQLGGVIVDFEIEYGGSGYFQPEITISDPTGTGAVVTPVLTLMNLQQQSQEVYPFSGIDLSPFPGVGSIFQVQSVSIIFSNYRYSLPQYSFSDYQAWVRQYPFQYQYVPAVCSQFGQGTDGSMYTYPIASQTYQMEWDCFCLPQSLRTNEDVEALPEPWTDLVPYFGAHLAFMEIQNRNASREMFELYLNMIARFNAAVRPGRRVNPYGRY
ncbi:MAG TPA: hypothetical protein VHT52_01420 [Stellaceae bacterium]|jgi:hypothetical protein|nr:hypothetical protein [Stellaceae bacterium]